ncbi:hypothetical protein [Archaeoglobus sp.]
MLQKGVKCKIYDGEKVKIKNGKKILKKYLRYKKKHKGYRGPVNWITPIKRKKIVVETEEVFRISEPKRDKKGWEFFGAWRVEDLDKLEWLKERNKMEIW